MGQSMFIVWRESVEALLVIGILHAWLRQQPDNRAAMRLLWSGVAAGLGLAALLGWALIGAGHLAHRLDVPECQLLDLAQPAHGIGRDATLFEHL